MAEAEGFQLFVGGLPPDITKEELQHVFKTYGKVTDIRILPNYTKTDVGSAFVSYASRRAASDAIQVLHEQYKIRADADRTIRVGWSDSEKGKRHGGGGDSKSSGGSRGSAGGKGGGDWQRSGGGWQQSGGERWKGGGGGGCWKGGRGDSRGGGEDRNESRSLGARDSWNGGDGGASRNSWQQGDNSWQDRGRGDGKSAGKGGDRGGGKSSGKGGGKGGGDNGTRLYVGNLPSDMEEDALRYVFETYGRVADVKILTGRSSTGQSCAILTYEKPRGAQDAIAVLDKKYEIRPGEGAIDVRYAKPQGSTHGGKGWAPY